MYSYIIQLQSTNVKSHMTNSRLKSKKPAVKAKIAFAAGFYNGILEFKHFKLQTAFSVEPQIQAIDIRWIPQRNIQCLPLIII